MGIKLTNNAFGTLAAGINSSATSITLTTGQGARFPTLSAGDYFYATLVDTSNNLEIVKCTARSTDVLTVVRGQESTTARSYSSGDRIEIRLTAQTFLDASAPYPSQTGNSGKFLTTDGSTPSWGTPTPANISDQNNTSTGYFDLPTGTTAQRPGSPAVGMIRYNTSIGVVEAYTASGWAAIGVDLSPFTQVNTTSMLHSDSTNLTSNGSTRISNYGGAGAVDNRAWSYPGLGTGESFATHGGHAGSSVYPMYAAIYLGTTPKAVNQLKVSLHGNSWGYFELQGSNDANTTGDFKGTGTWTSLTFTGSDNSQGNQNMGGNSSGYSDGNVLTFNYSNNIPYTHYRIWIKDSSRPNQSLGTFYGGSASYTFQLNRV